MFKLKIINKPKMIKMKCNIEFPDVVLANFQEKEVTPTKEIQEIKADQQYDGLSKVIVNAIPDEYIIPNGDINIIENGTYDVTDKTNAIVNIPKKVLGSKTITENGIYKATDDNLDGYSEVEVTTSGVDINDYFGMTPKNNTTIAFLIKKIPEIDTTGLTIMASFFDNCRILEKIPSLNTSSVKNFAQIFYNCESIVSIPDLDTSQGTNFASMFRGCANLETIPELDFGNATSINDMMSSEKNLVNLGGFKDLGKAYSTTTSAGSYAYRLVMYNATKLTYESLMNVINNLYDIKTKGCNTQYLQIGYANTQKLTAEEIAIATNKGWTVS